VSDTQWPRYEVFEQERPGQPHQNAGAVHAPDGELALLNARDVFVRRPQCHSLWVAPAGAIYARTAEELAADPAWRTAQAPPGAARTTYQVFCKRSQRQAQTFVAHAGVVEAGSPAEALRLAVEHLGQEPAYVWWVVPEAAITRSEAADVAPMFEPALAKPFRMPNYYHVHTQLRAIQAGGRPATNEPPAGDPAEPGDAPALPGAPEPAL
jgi:ring-1,2-phenylacetyl-CoA epoxidase subunit PaaB